MSSEPRKYAFAGPIVTESETQFVHTCFPPRNEFNKIGLTGEIMSSIRNCIDELEKDLESEVVFIQSDSIRGTKHR